MSKFYLMMLRDKDCNGKTYTFAYNMVSEKLDPLLNARLQSKFEFKTVEEAEANAREIAKQLFIYGLNLRDALQRYVAKRPWTASNMRYSQIDGKTFAKIVALPNHGMHLKACPWSLNLPKNITFWM